MPEPRQMTGLRLEKRMVTHLQRLAREESVRRDRHVYYTDLIREVVEEKYPLPKEGAGE